MTKILITTQAVDLNDPVLGFFHRWLLEFAKDFERIDVICIREGEYKLPANVFVHSLGKPSSRIKYIFRFYKYIFDLQHHYSTVFVHMNQEYILLGGIFWRLWGKRIVLWRNHKKGSFWTRIAGNLAHTVCHTSPEAYVAKFGNAVQMPLGIDTEAFKPRGTGDPNSILFLGRLDPVKRPDIFCEAMAILGREKVPAVADIYGDPTPGREAWGEELKSKYKTLSNISFHSGVRNDQTPALYSSHAIYVNLTPAGSFDKTIGEALASGCLVISANSALKGVIADALLVDADSPPSIANALKGALALSSVDRESCARRGRQYVEKEHSLSLLAAKLSRIYREV